MKYNVLKILHPKNVFITFSFLTIKKTNTQNKTKQKQNHHLWSKYNLAKGAEQFFQLKININSLERTNRFQHYNSDEMAINRLENHKGIGERRNKHL